MTNFVYYDPKTLEIKGQSDCNDVMQFPYIEAPELIFTPNFKVVKNDEGIHILEAIENQYTDEQWEKITTQ